MRPPGRSPGDRQHDVYCGDADIDGLFQEQGAELERRKREAACIASSFDKLAVAPIGHKSR